MDAFEISEIFPVKADKIYFAWLDSKTHSEMTDSEAVIDSSNDGKFDIFDGYITGTTIEKILNKKIVQKWRTTEFPDNAPDSDLEITLDELENGVRLTLHHSNIPTGQGNNYEEGWKDFYFSPMKEYFEAS